MGILFELQYLKFFCMCIKINPMKEVTGSKKPKQGQKNLLCAAKETLGMKRSTMPISLIGSYLKGQSVDHTAFSAQCTCMLWPKAQALLT